METLIRGTSRVALRRKDRLCSDCIRRQRRDFSDHPSSRPLPLLTRQWRTGRPSASSLQSTPDPARLCRRNVSTCSAAPPPPRSWTPTPFITETVGGAWHTYDIFSRLLKERIICLNGSVDDTVSASVVAQLLFLEADNADKPISLYINSPGGSVTAGLAIYDCMTYIQSEVSTICVGQAASMGSLLLCGGAAGKRFCLPHSSIMIHQPSGGYFGQATDIAIHAREILRVRCQLNDIYARHMTPRKAGRGSGRPTDEASSDGDRRERDGASSDERPSDATSDETSTPTTRTARMSAGEIDKLMERDYFMGAAEALDLGIVDEILERRSGRSDTLPGSKDEQRQSKPEPKPELPS